MSRILAQFRHLIKTHRCSTDFIKDKFPISKWLPEYNVQKLQGDIMAGTAVGLMVVPQSLAISVLAGLYPHIGLYSSFPGVFIYFFLGTCKDLNVGPTVMSALMTRRYNVTENSHMASILAFFCGIVLLSVGILRVGFIVQFISSPVFSGFVSAAAIVIAVSQLNDLLGIPHGPRPFFKHLGNIFGNIEKTRLGDAILGISCLIFLLSFHVIGKRISKSVSMKGSGIMRRILWTVNLGKNALVAIVATIIAYICHVSGHPDVFILAGKLPKGLPQAQNPLKTVTLSTNRTMTVSDAVASFGSGIGLLPLVAFIESIAVAKALARKNKYKIDASQELIAVGIGNIAASFFSGMPITGCFARSALSSASGAATPASGLVVGFIVIVAIQFLTPVFKFIPMTALAAMVIGAVIPMIEVNFPRKLWHTIRLDLLSYIAAFCCCFYELEMGIIVGASVSLASILYRNLRPRIEVSHDSPFSRTLKINGGMSYAGVEFLSQKLKSIEESFDRKDFEHVEIVIDCQAMFEIDYTVLQGLRVQVLHLRSVGIRVTFANIVSDRIRNLFETSGLLCPQEEQNELGDTSIREPLLCFESAV